MDARDELAKVILEGSVKVDRLSGRHVHLSFNDAVRVSDAILAAGYRGPRTITTAEEIKDLPALSMVVYDDMANGGPLEAYVVPDDGTVMFKDRYPFHLMRMDGEYVNADVMPLPLTVVYEVGA